MKKWVASPSVRVSLLLFVALRLCLFVWGVVAISVNPIPETADETVRPYLGERPLVVGWSSLLAGPWQRFDGQRYMRIARDGYAQEEDSVFPPLYPLLVRAVSWPMGGGTVGRLTAGLLLSNLATLALFILFHHVTWHVVGEQFATRALVYLAIFPSAFFWFAPYTESLFMVLTLGCLWLGRPHADGEVGKVRWVWAGVLGFLAALTRLTGWVLVVPLLIGYLGIRLKGQHLEIQGQDLKITHLGKWIRQIAVDPFVYLCLLPAIGTASFIGWRWWVGLPPLSHVYQQYWYQVTGFPGRDIFVALNTLFLDGSARAGDFMLLPDLLMVLLLTAVTILTLRKYGLQYGIYCALLLFFILLPASDLKPLYSFTRYALAFFPLFWAFAEWGENPWLNRLILYPSITFYLYLSGQFLAWGWVA